MDRSTNASNFAEPAEDIESWKIPDWVKVEDTEQFKSLCDIHCQNEEEIREMTELRRKLHKKQHESETGSKSNIQSEVERPKYLLSVSVKYKTQ